MSLSPIKWFTDGKLDLLVEGRGKIDRDMLGDFGWEGDYLSAVEFGDTPKTPGVYVYLYELENKFLYVGQTRNITKRAFNINHHKLEWIIDRLGNNPFANSDSNDVFNDIYVYYKEVDAEEFNNSLKRSLIWCEALTIGLLKPVFQDNISDIYDFYTGQGLLRNEDKDEEEEELDA